MIYGYLRVSTGKQTVENQKFEIIEYLKHNNIIENIKFIEEVKSGTVDYKERTLGKLLKKLKENDILICTELSRLGRSMLMVMEILNTILEKQVNLITIKENMKFDNNISSKVISFAFSLSAEIERNLLSQRTKEALALRREQGIKLGRPIGAHNKIYICDKYKDKIIDMLHNDITPYKIAKKFKLKENTVRNYIKRFNLKWALFKS